MLETRTMLLVFSFCNFIVVLPVATDLVHTHLCRLQWLIALYQLTSTCMSSPTEAHEFFRLTFGSSVPEKGASASYFPKELKTKGVTSYS